MAKIFEISKRTTDILNVLIHMSMDEKMTFSGLSAKVRFEVTSTNASYQSAKRLAERDHGIYIGSLRGIGFFRGKGDDMADSLEPMAKSMRRIAKRSIARADLAIANNLPDEKYERVVERRTRASLIYSTSGSPLPTSNRKRQQPAPEAPKLALAEALMRAG